MPTYKIMGIYSFADNLKQMHVNDNVILKHENYNIKSKNAIGVYSLDNKKLGYMPNESKYELETFNNAFIISKLVLNQDYPILEINRYYPSCSYLDNVEYPYEKKLKYEYVLVNISNELAKSLTSLEKYLLTKRIKVKRTAVIYVDELYINILIEVTKGFEQFETVTMKYFKEHSDKYEELFENNIIDNTFFRELMIYRLESYYEKNYSSIHDDMVPVNHELQKLIPTIVEETVHDELDIEVKGIDCILLTKLYLSFLQTENSYFILKYINKHTLKEYTEVKKGMKKLISNYKILNTFNEKYSLKRGKFSYDHKLKIYDYIDFTNDDTVFIVSDTFKVNYLHAAYLTKKENLIIYNPIEGKINIINNIK